jgi:hypothetical protein
MLMAMRADMGKHFQIADENMPDRARGIRDMEGRDVGFCSHGADARLKRRELSAAAGEC